MDATFITSVNTGIWSNAEDASDWLRAYWSRQPSHDDLTDLERGWALVIDMMRRRDASAVEIEEKQRECVKALEQDVRWQGQGG